MDELVSKIVRGDSVTVSLTHPVELNGSQIHFLLLLAQESGSTVILQYPPSVGINFNQEVPEIDIIDYLIQRSSELAAYGSVNIVLPSVLSETFDEEIRSESKELSEKVTVSDRYDGVSEVIIDLGLQDDYVLLETGRVVRTIVPLTDLIPVPHPHMYRRILFPLWNNKNRGTGLAAYCHTHYANDALSKVRKDLTPAVGKYDPLTMYLPRQLVNSANGLSYYADILLNELSKSYPYKDCCTLVALVDTCTCDFASGGVIPGESLTEHQVRIRKIREDYKELVSDSDPEVYWKAWHHRDAEDIIIPEVYGQVSQLIESLTGEKVSRGKSQKGLLFKALEIIREVYPRYTAVDRNFYRHKGEKYVLSSWSWNTTTSKNPEVITVLAHGGNVISSFV